jgi:transposase-like protein
VVRRVIENKDFLWEAYVAWLCTPVSEREPRTQTELAEQFAVAPNTLREWRQNPDFLRLWETQFRRTVGSPERMQKVLDTLYRTATDPDDPKHVQAAAKYVEIVEGARPQKVEVSLSRAVDLTDEQLEEMLASKAAVEATQRGLRVVE